MHHPKQIFYEWGAKAYVQNNFDYYQRNWAVRPDDNYYAGWNWAAFFLAFTWAVYRKLYIQALLVFLISMILPFGRLLACLVFGLFGNAMVRAKAQKAVDEAVFQHGDLNVVYQQLVARGGTSLAAAFALEAGAVVLFLLAYSLF